MDLTAGTWSYLPVDYIAYPDAKIDAKASAEATFFAGGRGLMYHHDQHISEFKRRIKGNRLIVMYGRDNTKHILQLQIIKAIADSGMQVVMDARSDDGAPFIRSGFMLKHQGLHLIMIIRWGVGTPITFSMTTIRITYTYLMLLIQEVNGRLLLQVKHAGKVGAPVLGTVATCPDNSCYVSCEFKLKLLATEGDVVCSSDNEC